VIHPSVDLGDAATTRFRNVPRSVQYLLRGIGADERSGANLMSYVAFHHDYTRYLVECGYEDTMRRASDIRAFLSAAQPVGDETVALA
jgi:NTE family protein